jgi:hypothetical protein
MGAGVDRVMDLGGEGGRFHMMKKQLMHHGDRGY